MVQFGNASICAIAASLLGIAIPHVALAQTSEQAQEREWSVPSGALAPALVRFGAQAGLQFNVESKLTDGKTTRGISGRYTVEQALSLLLADSGLRYRFVGARTVIIEELPDVGDARLTSVLRVGGATGDGGYGSGAVNGVNGSRDVTATEGTGSFTTGATSIASKAPQEFKDTPQSVSVITQQRIIEQNINDFSQLMAQTTGVTVVNGGDGPLNPQFFSRGLPIQRLQMDGGAPIDITDSNWGLTPQFDMALYDHAEILRGVDGLFNGYGDPGGVISLTRKRPLDHRQILVELQAGTWDNRRAMLDVSGPLTRDRSLRARVVGVWQKRDFFYDFAKDEKVILSGTVEYDLTPSTLVMAGINRTWQDGIPFTSGLPFYENGADLMLPRDTCLCFPGNSYDNKTTEIYARIEQGISRDWNATINVSRIKQNFDSETGIVSGAVNPVTGFGTTLEYGQAEAVSTQTKADVTVTGTFKLFGQEQRLIVGGNYNDADGGGSRSYLAAQFPVDLDILNFDRNDPAYALTEPFYLSGVFNEARSRQYGAYATFQLTVWNPLHLSAGIRYSAVERSDAFDFYCTRPNGCRTFDDPPVTYELGELRTTLVNKYKATDFSWPPTLTASLDLTRSLAAHVSYADIFQDQSTSLSTSGVGLGGIDIQRSQIMAAAR